MENPFRFFRRNSKATQPLNNGSSGPSLAPENTDTNPSTSSSNIEGTTAHDLSNNIPSSSQFPVSSFFEGSENIGISGGRFLSQMANTMHVTYNHSISAKPVRYRDYRERSRSRSPGEKHEARGASDPSPSPPRIVLSAQKSNEIYERHMLLKGRGFPLWIPEPSATLPLQYRREGINVGDVGMFTPAGGFSFLFNICLPEKHPINQGRVPPGFRPINPPIDPIDIHEVNELKPGCSLTSNSIQKSQLDEMNFEGTSEGAILAMPEGAKSRNLENTAIFEQYAAEHIEDWYRYVNGPRGRNAKNGDLRLVTGWDKSTSWAMATLTGVTQGKATQLKLVSKQDDGQAATPSARAYSWEYSGAAEVRVGPGQSEIEELRNEDPEPEAKYMSQCLFVRTMSPMLSDETWAKFNEVSLRAKSRKDRNVMNKGKDILDSSQTFSNSSNETNDPDFHSTPQGRSMADTSPGQHKNLAFDMIYTPPRYSKFHPSDGVNGLLLKRFPDAKMVITEDKHWCLALRENESSFPHPDYLLQNILYQHSIQVHDGIISFNKRNAQLNSMIIVDEVPHLQRLYDDGSRVNSLEQQNDSGYASIDIISPRDRQGSLSGHLNRFSDD